MSLQRFGQGTASLPARRTPDPRTLPLALLVALVACVDRGDEAPEGFDLQPIELRLPAGTGMPNLHAAADGRTLLTYLDEVERDAWVLRLAARDDLGWSEPATVASDRPFFANWADFPSSVVLGDGQLAVHWLEKVAAAPYAYHVLVSLSVDGGETWSDPVVPHRDASPTEHGFVSMVPWEDGAALVWLDGREMEADPADSAAHVSESAAGGPVTSDGGPQDAGSEGGAMTLRATTLRPDGSFGAELLLDDRTCECCQTALVRTAQGLVAAYRDRSPAEVRDISAVRFDGERWSEPTAVHDDGWEIPGCPVNGPQLAAAGERVAAAWFTGAAGRPSVRIAFSEDGGARWNDPVRVDEGTPIGRADVAFLPDGSAAVAWIEAREEGAEVRVRRVSPAGRPGPAVTISETGPERASGFPRMALAGEELLVAWTLPGPEGGVRVRAVHPR